MEWIILDDTNLYFSQRGRKKLFAGEPRTHALFLFDRRAKRLCIVETVVHSLLMLLMSLLSLALFTLFLGNPLLKAGSFIGLVLLGGWSLSLVFTFLAAIAAKAQQNAAIMAILGFPLIIPQLILLMRLSNATFSATISIPVTTILLLIALDLMVILLAVILFPFLWKD